MSNDTGLEREVGMGTAAIRPASRLVWHERGSWSAREDRVPSAVWLAILWVGMIAGFWMDFPSYLHEIPAPKMVVHIHGAVFSMWMFLLTAQVLLVLGNRVAWHRRLGWVMAGWAALMAVLGPWAAMSIQSGHLLRPDHSPESNPPFLAVNLVDIIGFLVLLAWGIALRKNPAAHKRMMILSSVSLADPGFARLMSHSVEYRPHDAMGFFWFVFYGNVLLIALMAGWDWWRGRLVRSFAIGAAGLLAGEVLCVYLIFWAPWRTLTTGWVVEWARHFG
jgi:hypothetical protein